jgi:hypothetical protein
LARFFFRCFASYFIGTGGNEFAMNSGRIVGDSTGTTALNETGISENQRTLRYSLYECPHRRADALFELTDAILTAHAVPSPVNLASKRRIVAAGAAFTPPVSDRRRIDTEALQELLACHPLAESGTTPD